MSHLFREGFFVRQPAWHGLGTVVADYPGRDEAMRLAGHDHHVEERQLLVTNQPFTTEVPSRTDVTGARVVTAYKAVTRADNGDLLAIANADYPVIQNDRAWDLLDAICAVPNVQYETGGVLDGRFGRNENGNGADWQLKRGTVYWVLALLDEPAQIYGDPSAVYAFLLATWSHDGTQALRIKETDVRVVCANTQYLALGGAGREFAMSFRHVGAVNERIADAVVQVDNVRTAHQAFIERANELARMEVSDAGLERFVEIILPLPEVAREQLMSDRQVRNVETARDAVRALLNGPTCEGIRNTAWGLVQAGVEHHDHLRRVVRQDAYFRRNLMHVSRAKQAFEETAVQVAAEYPV